MTYSLLCLRFAIQFNHVVTDMQNCIPGYLDSILDALMGGTAARMNLQRSFGCLTRLRGYCEVIVYCNRVNANSFTNTSYATINGGGICLTVIRDLAP